MMVHTIASDTGLASYAAAFGGERAGNRTFSGSALASSDFYEHFAVTISSFGSFADRVNKMVQELHLGNDRSLAARRNETAAEDLVNSVDSQNMPAAEVSRIQPALLALLAIPETQGLDTLA